MKLKSSLLFTILENPESPNRYSKAFLSMKNVFKLEEEETDSIITTELKTKFSKIKKQYNDFHKNIPLIVVERYFMNHIATMNKFVYLEYQGNEMTDLKISELFFELEQFFNKIFQLACELANYYNLEIKLNKPSNGEKSYV